MNAPDSSFAVSPHAIRWDQQHPDGTRSATLVGTRAPGDVFTYAFYIPPGAWDSPHSHMASAHLHVAHGTLHLGYGERMDRSAAARHPTGSFLHVPAGVVHFDGSEVETIIIGTARGPWSTDYV